MLLNLHVRNLALIKEADIDLEKGLNIFTGETGAGKSLLLGSVNLALGARLSSNVIRHGADHALVELTFSLENEETKQAVKDAGFEPEDDLLVISRKITGTKSIFRLNGESATSSQIRKLAAFLLDIHGQHDHQSLLYNDRQLAILDEYGSEAIRSKKEIVSEDYSLYMQARKRYSDYDMDEKERLREVSLLQYELNEIEEAAVFEGEEEELETRYKKLNNARSILTSMNRIHELTGYDGGAADLIGKAVQEILPAAELDPELEQISSELADVDSILSDITQAAASYISDFTYSDNELEELESRLDVIRRLKAKYGSSVSKIEDYAEKQRERLQFLTDYEASKAALEKEIAAREKVLKTSSLELSEIRKDCAEKLSAEIIEELKDLNFQKVAFEIRFEEKETYSANGTDGVEYIISVNPGEPMLPLSRIASGGELSRIMLAIKTILTRNDPTETLIFDEIDTGISGRTAVKVAKKLSRISKDHQVLCITHLAQIAAAADAHYEIDKTVDSKETFTHIMKLNETESEEELARILGGSTITEAVIENAREMKRMARSEE